MNDKQASSSALGELIGAVGDSFTRDRTDRLVQLEERLARLSRWATIGTVIAFAYFGYHLWGEMRSELGVHPAEVERADAVVTADAADEARSSIFLIFAAALGGPIVLIFGYVVLGFFYNVCHDALVRRIPLARFLVVPVLLLMGFIEMDSRREDLKEALLDGYGKVEHRIAAALSLRQQARKVGEAVRGLHQMEAQLHALNEESQTDDETIVSSQAAGPTSTQQSAEGEAMTQDEAVRRLGTMMLQLQGMTPSQPHQGKGQATAEFQPAPAADTAPAPVVDRNAVPTPATPADI